MSTVDQVFSDSIARLQQWLQFLERKQNEYQMQLNRVQRRNQPAADVAPEPAPVSPTASQADEDPWQ